MGEGLACELCMPHGVTLISRVIITRYHCTIYIQGACGSESGACVGCMLATSLLNPRAVVATSSEETLQGLGEKVVEFSSLSSLVICGAINAMLGAPPPVWFKNYRHK